MARSTRLYDRVLHRRRVALIAAVSALLFGGACNAATTIGQVADVDGAHPNQLLGYGLVVGLNGTGDTAKKSPFTVQRLQAELARLGVQRHPQSQDTKDVASALITASIDPLNVDKVLDVNVSAIGDATDIIGGRLIPTALIGGDGRVYAVAAGLVDQGKTHSSSKSLGDDSAKPTSGRIVGGGFIEQASVGVSRPLHLNLHDPDLQTAACVAAAINAAHAGTAAVQSAKLVAVNPPASIPLDAFINDLRRLDFASAGGCARTPAA